MHPNKGTGRCKIYMCTSVGVDECVYFYAYVDVYVHVQ